MHIDLVFPKRAAQGEVGLPRVSIAGANRSDGPERKQPGSVRLNDRIGDMCGIAE